MLIKAVDYKNGENYCWGLHETILLGTVEAY